MINVNLDMSRALLEVPRAQRGATAPRLLKEIVEVTAGDAVVLDNIEILFAPDLKLDPLRALRRLSPDRTLVAYGTAESRAADSSMPSPATRSIATTRLKA